MFYVNCVGPQNNGKNIITFDGGSTVYNGEGKPCALMNNDHKQQLQVFDLKLMHGTPEVQRPHTDKIAEKRAAIISGLKYFATMNGMETDPNTIIGLSGGIDSAVAACLFVEAYGKKKVVTLNMPTQYNSEATRQAAAQVARNLNVAYVTLPIGELVKCNLKLLCPMTTDLVVPPLVEENVQAKIRGTSILSNAAQMVGGIFSNNGNKLEVFLGYATLYGDWGGAIAPLGDLTKAEVYDMARYINDRSDRAIIPKQMIPDAFYQFGEGKIKPSAELRENQVDPIKVGYHDAIVEKVMDYRKASPRHIMQAWLDKRLPEYLGIDPKYMELYNLDNADIFIDDLTWLIDTMHGATFKRVQSVPIIITSKSAFGYDYRESILPRDSWRTAEMLKKIEEVKKRGNYYT
ncbi:MAG: NAD(+) synthase [Candidatus Competibacteraceae bacterium]|nr:NAD(+) synthase [Candidatus Competibacteraceae bacterium]